ncbi:MAG: TonB-dependent siderophore receptor [Mangrovicoccus sp.]|nr:TonB-dependent siderophore receptor [Mangrovicoccus sp.]
MRLVNGGLSVGSLFVLAMGAQPSLAQDGEPLEPLEPITISLGEGNLGSVTGFAAEASGTALRGLPADLARTPRSVTVITPKQAEEQGARTLQDTLAYTPGVAAGTFGSDGRYDQFTIRGFDSQNSSNYRDGMPLRTYGFTSWRTEVFGMERIEVLRGPTADLFGANAPGGLVNAVSKRPEFAFGGEVQGSLFNHGGGELALDVTGPASENLAYRLVALFNDSGTQYSEADKRRIYLAPSFTWRASERTNVTVFAQYQKDDIPDSYVLVPQYGSQLPNPIAHYGNDFYSGDPYRNTVESTQNYIGYELDHEITDSVTFRSRARYAKADWFNQTVYSGAFYASTGAGRGAIDSTADVDFDIDGDQSQYNFDNGLEIDFNAGAASGTVIVGVDYYGARDEYSRIDAPSGFRNLLTGAKQPLDTIKLEAGYDQEIKQTGLYAISTTEIGSNWLVNAGLRYDWLDIDVETTSNLEFVNPSFEYTSKEEHLSANLGVSYTFENGVSLYGNAARSFNLPPSLGLDVNGEPLKVQEANAYELGARFRPEGSNSLLSLALFHIEKTNEAQQVLPGRYEQSGKVRSRGVELGANYALGHGFSVIGAYTYLDAEITEDRNNQGNDFARTPRHSGALWLSYDVQDMGLEGLTLGGGIRYIGERYSDAANTEAYKLSAVTLFDASIAYTRNDWRAILAARNLTNKEHVTFCTGSSARAILGFSPAQLAEASGCTYGTGREISFTLSRLF